MIFLKREFKFGFSLAEMVATLTIGSMVLVAVLSLYNRTNRSIIKVSKRLDEFEKPREVLQLIAEDLDKSAAGISRMAAPDTTLTIVNKSMDGYHSARLKILKSIRGDNSKEQNFETIIWQADFSIDANGLVLYRSHTGLNVEDKLLDKRRKDWEENYSFIPVCQGVTFFSVEAIIAERKESNWKAKKLPRSVVVTISFTPASRMPDGSVAVAEEAKISRVVSLDRTREIPFQFIEKTEDDKQ